MPPVIIAPAASNWIRERAQYLAEHSQPAALRFRDALRNAVQQLADHPNSGPPGLIAGTRRLLVGDYVISYRVRSDRGRPIRVEIFAVRHGRQRDAYEPR